NEWLRLALAVKPFADGPAWFPLLHPGSWLLVVGLATAIAMRRPAVLALAFVLATMMVPSQTRAQNSSSDDFAIKAVSQTRLAYVVTGNADVDS
ncbi:hypothetical protein ABTD54_18375, partial [Acinetobacter baumannii]